MNDQEDGFLNRWSRLKRSHLPEAVPEGVPAGEPEGDPAGEPEAGPDAAIAAPAPQACPVPGVPEIDLSALPRIEELTEASDFTLFLRPGIPAALRGAALRRMWSLDPVIRDFVGPADYAWNYNDPAGMPPGFSFDLGGNLQKLLAQAIGEPEETPEAAAGLPEQRLEADCGDDEAPPLEPDASPQLVAQPAANPPASDFAALDSEDPPAPRRRHGGALPA